MKEHNPVRILTVFVRRSSPEETCQLCKRIRLETSMRNIAKKNRNIHMMFLFFSTFIGPAALVLLGTVLPDLMCIMNIDLKSASSLFFAVGFGRCFSCFIAIFVKDRQDVTLTLVSALVVTAVLQPLIANSASLPLTMCFYFVVGCCTGIFMLGQYKLVTALLPTSNWGYHLISSGFGFASLFSPPLASVFVRGHQPSQLHHLSNMTVFSDNQFTCGTNIHLAFVILSFFTLFIAAGFITNYFSIINNGMLQEQAKDEEEIHIIYEEKPKLDKCTLSLLMFLFGTITASLTSVISLTVTYGLHSQLHLDVKTSSFLTSLFSICLLCARILCTFLADRIKPHVILWFHLTLLLVTSVLFVAYKDSSITVLWITSALHGFGTGPIFSCLFTWIKTHMDISAQFLSLIMMLDNIGNLVHPTITGILMDLYGPDMFTYAIAGTRFLQFILFGVINILTYNRSSHV